MKFVYIARFGIRQIEELNSLLLLPSFFVDLLWTHKIAEPRANMTT